MFEKTEGRQEQETNFETKEFLRKAIELFNEAKRCSTSGPWSDLAECLRWGVQAANNASIQSRGLEKGGDKEVDELFERAQLSYNEAIQHQQDILARNKTQSERHQKDLERREKEQQLTKGPGFPLTDEQIKNLEKFSK